MGYIVLGYIKDSPERYIEERRGVLSPTRCDGIYSDRQDAEEVASYMREVLLRPDEVVEVVELLTRPGKKRRR